MPVESQLSHRVVRSANLPYITNQSPESTDALFTTGSFDILTSLSGYAQRRPGFADKVETTSTTFVNLQRQYVWERNDSTFIEMACDISGSQSIVYKRIVGTDGSYVPIYTDTGSTTPFDFCVSNNTCYFSNGHAAKKWDPVNGVSNWGITIGSFSGFSGPNGPSSGTDVAVSGGQPWANPSNITSADGTYSTITVSNTGTNLSLGPNFGSSASSSGGGNAWANPSYAQADDGLYAKSTIGASGTSQALAISGYNFSIPATATILGITVEIKRYLSAGTGTIDDNSVRLMQTGSPVGSNLAAGGNWPGSPAYVTYGGSSNLWGTSWTPALVNASGFGVQLIAQETGGASSAQAAVDAIRVTITYSIPITQSISDYLEAKTFGFGLATGNTVQGIQVGVTGFQASNNNPNVYLQAYLLKGGNIVGTAKVVSLPTSNGTVTLGGTSDLWGTSWTFSDINSTSFGVALQVVNNSSTSLANYNIDFVSVTVYDVGGPNITVSGSAGTFTAVTGYQYVFCYGNSNTGHVSSPSPASASTGAFSNKLNVGVDLTASSDPQVNQIRVFRSTDSVATGTTAGTFFEIPTSPYPNTTQTITDSASDVELNVNSIAPTPTFNDAPLPLQCPVYFAGRIWGMTGNYVVFSALEENTIGVPEESFPSGKAGNYWAFNQPPQALAVAGTGSNQQLLILCGGTIYGISGNSLDTFRRYIVSARHGCRNIKAVSSLGGMVAWRDSSGQVWATDGSSLNEIGIDIRPDLTPYTPGTDSVCFHIQGNYHWLIVSTGTLLYVYDLDKEQWMPPWTFACNQLFSGETSPGTYQLLASTTTKALALNTSGSNNDNGATYQPIARTGLQSLVPDFGTRFSFAAVGFYDEPSRTGCPFYFQVDSNNVQLDDIRYLNDDDPQITASSKYQSIFGQITNPETAFVRAQGANLKQNVWSLTQPTARWISWEIKGKKQDDQLKIYSFFMAYKQTR